MGAQEGANARGRVVMGVRADRDCDDRTALVGRKKPESVTDLARKDWTSLPALGLEKRNEDAAPAELSAPECAPGVVAKSELGQCDRPGGNAAADIPSCSGRDSCRCADKDGRDQPEANAHGGGYEKERPLAFDGVAYRRGCGAAFA